MGAVLFLLLSSRARGQWMREQKFPHSANGGPRAGRSPPYLPAVQLAPSAADGHQP
jgi:hypothetical protein